MTICIADVHGQWKKAQKILDEYDNPSNQIILLGDFVDFFGDTLKQNQDTAEWWMNIATKENIITCQGNHDLSYLRHASRCSGWSPDKQRALDRVGFTNPEFWAEHACFVYPKWINDQLWIFSHAGIHPHYLPTHLIEDGCPERNEELVYWLLQEENYAFRCLKNKMSAENHWFFNAGYARGGPHLWGGVTWLDWRDEFEPIEGVSSIVGHTRGKEVRTRHTNASRNFCLDTNMQNFVTIDDKGEITIHDI